MDRGRALTAGAALIVVLSATGFLLSHPQPRPVPPGPASPRDSGPAPAPFFQSPGAIAYGRRAVRGSLTFDRTTALYVVLPGNPPRRVYVGSACCPAWSPDGGRLLLTVQPSGERTQEAVIAVNRGMTEFGAPGLALGPGAWDRGGRRIAAWAADPADPSRNGIYLFDTVTGRRVSRLTRATGSRVQRPLAFSPNSRWLLVYEEGSDPRQGELATVPAAGGALRAISPPGTSVRCCFWGPPGSWSPDGRLISFAAFGGSPDSGTGGVLVASPDGRNVQSIAAGNWTASARWSPTGGWIAFDKLVSHDGSHALFLVRPDGSGQHRVGVTPTGISACCAQWSSNGRELVYQRGPSNVALRLWILNIDGSGTRPLTGSSQGFTFAWGQ
jgi:Tol biopolymer transport system component